MMNKHIIRFPKDGQASLVANEWQVWDGEGDEGAPSRHNRSLHSTRFRLQKMLCVLFSVYIFLILY